MKQPVFAIFIGVLFLAGCAAPNKHLLRIETTPIDAIVSCHQTRDISDATRQISGTTPLEALFDFGKAGYLWLEIEKRGFAPQLTKIYPDTKAISIDLEAIKYDNGEMISEYAVPDIKRILLAKPDIKIYERGFGSEKISQEKSASAQDILTKGIEEYFSINYQVVSIASSGLDDKLLRPLWRDVPSAMELLDPVRLKYAAYPPLLETESSRDAVSKLGNKYGAEVMLFVTGKGNIETAGFKAGAAITSATAVSVNPLNRSPEAREALSHIYAPHYGGGSLTGKAALVDCSNGEILWVGRGFLKDILTNLYEAVNNN